MTEATPRPRRPRPGAPEDGHVPDQADFNRYADTYRDHVQDSIAFSGVELEVFTRKKAAHLLDLAQRHLGDPAELDVLDVGCGVGETDQMLRGSFGTLTGCDIAADAIERASRANPWASYRHYAPADGLPGDDATFDLVFAICVLHHVPPAEWSRFAREMARVTRPGGLVAIFEHNPLNPLTRRAVSNCEFDEDAVLVSRRRVSELLTEARAEPVESAYIVFVPRVGDLVTRLERQLSKIPLGAQYYVAGRPG